jgi:tripartite-type tricarboxylate transporter receptor subunit TctC
VPLAQSLAKTDEARQLLQAGIQDPADFYRPYVAPPGTPKERVGILRQAFDATMKDSEFLADAKKANLDIEPITGQEMERLVAGIFKLNPTMVAKLNSILNPS